MTPERWQRIKPLLHSALEREPSERSAFLAAECAGDEALRRDVESLIASHDHAGEFIESPAFEVMAGSLQDDQVVGRNLGPYAIEGRNHLLLESEPAWAKFVTEVRRFLSVAQS